MIGVPVTYELRPEIDCVFITFAGVIDDQELLEAQRQMFVDPKFRGHYARLIDGQCCERLELDQLTVYYVTRAAIVKGMKRAALVAPNNVIYGLMRMYESYAGERAECAVFRDIADAVEWLASTQR